VTAGGDPEHTFLDRYLEPADRLNEVLFGLIMVLTFTLTAGIAIGESPDAPRELLIATIGCNLAWGVIDAAMYVMGALMERSRRAREIERVRTAPDDATARRIVAHSTENTLAASASAEDRERLFRLIRDAARQSPPERLRIRREDLQGGLASFFLVVLSTIPAAIPFLLIDEPRRALRVSNLVLIALLFAVGQRWGRHAYVNPWGAGFAFLGVGLALVAIAIALGG
jgi:hypothetical protein